MFNQSVPWPPAPWKNNRIGVLFFGGALRKSQTIGSIYEDTVDRLSDGFFLRIEWFLELVWFLELAWFLGLEGRSLEPGVSGAEDTGPLGTVSSAAATATGTQK